ncbi:AMP-binding protein [Pseudonocardia pini]|uniref:AMP-binding protein n=1 Tax=Pseudonocardia pini TaxID=2758030 RepID=UPI001C6904F8|nr:AMP-binding protein [Pseudonocardia pini]
MGALRRAVESCPDTTFLDVGGARWTYAQVHDRVARLAGGLAGLGVGRGDTVVTLLDNSLDSVVTLFAVNALDAILVPLNTALKGEFLRHQVADSLARVVIAEADYAERVRAVAAGLPELRHLVSPGGPLDLAELYAADPRPAGPLPDPGALSMLIYTAGTTGPSKGCMVSHNQGANLGRQVSEMGGRRPDETLWTPLPLFHVNALCGSVLSTAMLQGTVSIARRFSLSGFWPEIERSGARMVSLLGIMIPLIAQMPDTEEMRRCHGQLRIALGAPFPAEAARTWRERFGVERAGAPGYGNTEAAMIVCAPLSGAPVPGASGRRNADFDVRIVDEQDRELPPGETGEVICRPLRPNVMFAGYWNRPQATLDAFRNLWYHTGDLGRFDADGNFHFADRKKDYLRRGGENISSFELESTFQQHPGIAEVAVHAVPSALSEDEVKVTAVLAEGSTLTEEELCAWAVDRLPYYAVPRYVELRAELPKNDVGRILKYLLRDEGVTPSTWDRTTSGIELVKR